MSTAHPRAGTPGHGAARPAWRRMLDRLGGGDVDGGNDWISRGVALAMLVAVAVVVGMQIAAPDKRTISVIIAMVLFGIAWRIDLVSGIGVLILAMPYPRGTVFGSTNVVLVLLVAVIWLLRVSLRRAAPPRGSLVDLPLVALLMAFVVSFYNVENATSFKRALENFGQLLACVALFYLVINIVRTPAQLEKLHLYQAISVAMVGLLAIYEVFNPTGTVVPGWIEFHHGPRSAELESHNLRVGGPFTDFELLSEYCALNLIFLIVLIARARTIGARIAFIGIAGLMWIAMFATVTRGGFVSLAVGLLYFGWLMRHSLNMVRVVTALALLVVSFFVMNFLVTNLTQAGDLLARFLDPQSLQFEHGMPVARAPIWQTAWERMMQHPIIGHGPYYSTERGLSYWTWPHNGYLYIGNLVGFVGLSFFLWLLARLWIISRPVVRDLRDPNYAKSFLVVAHVQLFVFLIDQTKIDFMRNSIYIFQVWMMFASIAVARRLAEPSVPSPTQPGARA